MTSSQTATPPAGRLASGEPALLARLLNTLLREDLYRLRQDATVVNAPDGDWLRVRLAGGHGLIPVRPDGFLCDVAVREPVLVHRGRRLTTVAEVLAEIARLAPEADKAGHQDLAAECAQTLATWRLHERHHADVLARLADAPRDGMAGAMRDEALAAYLDHPVYPTGRCRFGLAEPDLVEHAPEFAPSFALRWVALPAGVVTAVGTLPAQWPDMAAVGLPAELAATHVLLPTHPLTARHLEQTLQQVGGADAPPAERALLAPGSCLTVRPTLSMRTVALCDDPAVHLKLPLPTSTLGVRNRRTIKPATLIDGAVTQRLIEAVLDREPELRERVLLADETSYAHAGHELLGVLVRRYPDSLDGARVVPAAALLAPAPGGGLVIEEVAAEFYGGDVAALFDAYLALLIRWHGLLWLRYGVALEAHAQNLALVLDRRDGGPRLRLLYKDNDGPRVHAPTLAAALPEAAAAGRYADERIATPERGGLADMFVTITLHLCAAAPAFGLAEAGLLPIERGLDLIRAHLRAMLAEHADGATATAAGLAETRLFGVPRLPVKTMLTAGTLMSKRRSGAADVNKHYGADGPNYLLANPPGRADVR